MSKRRNKKLSEEEITEIVEYKSNRKVRNENPLMDIRIDVKPKTENQRKLMNSIRDNDVTLAIGPSGCGKTFIACSQALKLLKEHPDKYKRILLVKSIIQLKSEDAGTLPGDINEKMKYIMASYMDSFYKLIGEGLTNKLLELGVIRFELLGSIRGRSFSNVILISDEHQNINIDNTRTLLTRISEDTKYIIMGDGEQIDMKNKKESSLEIIADKMIKNKVEGVDVIRLEDNDILRHRLTSYFLNLFR
jgi:phosphate starvation-inducible PhoH-like protein